MKWEEAPLAEETEKKRGKWEEAALVEAEGSAMDYASGFGGGVNTGLAGMAGAPVDITNMILSTVGLGSEEPIGGSKWIKRQAGKVSAIPGAGDPFAKGPDTTLGRVINRAGEEVGASALPAAGMLRAARGIPPAFQAGRGVIQQQLLDPIRRAPGAATVGEVTAAGGAGIGAGAAKEYYPESKTAETVGQLAGGVLPTVAAHSMTGLAVRGTAKLFSRFSSKGQRLAASKVVNEAMGGALTPDVQSGLVEAERLSQAAPGFKPSIAEATKDPSLVATQIEIERNAKGAFLDQVKTRRIENAQAIEAFRGKKAPPGDLNPEFVLDTAKNRIDTVGENIDNLIGKNIQAQKDVVEGLPTVDRLSGGKTIREGIMQAKAEASIKMSKRAEELNLEGINVTDDYQAWLLELEAKYAPTSRYDDPKSVPTIYKQMMKEIPAEESALDALALEFGGLGEEVGAAKEVLETSFIDLKALRERITDDLMDTLASANPDRRKARFLTRLKKDTDTFIDGVGNGLGDDYAQFRKEYFEEYITPFESGAVFKAKNKDGTGFYRARDEVVADMFFDNQSAARQYYDTFKDSPSMMDVMSNSVMDNMRREVAFDGIVDSNKLARWTRKHSDALNELPDIKANVQGVEKAQNMLLNRQQQLVKRKNNIETKALAKQLSKYAKGDVSADKIMNDAISDPRKMTELKSFIKKDPDALQALQRTVWEKATQGNSEDVLKFIIDHEKSLKVIYGPQHFRDINDVALMRAMTEIVPTQTGKAFIPKPFEAIEKFAGMGIPQMSTRWYAFMSGRLAKSYLAADIARSVLYTKGRAEMENLFRTALYDPQIAKDMAATVKSLRLPEPRAKRLFGRYFALGLPYIERDYVEISNYRNLDEEKQ